MVASLPELMPESVAATLIAGGVVPMNGLSESFAAIAAAVAKNPTDLGSDLLLPGHERQTTTLTEAEAKSALAAFGLPVPTNRRALSVAAVALAAEALPTPFVLKGEGLAHKSESGAVVLGLTDSQSAIAAAQGIEAESFLLEEMVTGALADQAGEAGVTFVFGSALLIACIPALGVFRLMTRIKGTTVSP